MATSPNQPEPTPEEGSKKRGLAIVLVIVFMLITVVAFGFAIYLLTQTASPEAVDHDQAVESIRGGDSTDPDGDVDESAGPSNDTDDGRDDGAVSDGPVDVSGAWSVDTTTGTWTYESASGSFIGFRIGEELVGVGTTEAVGRTGNVAGTLDIANNQLSAGAFSVDMASITTNESRRDQRVRGALNVATHPEATFVLTEPLTFGDVTAEATVDLQAVGDLSINGITQSVEFPLTASLVDDTIIVTGSLEIVFADFDVTVPSAALVLSANDYGLIELQLLFTRN